MALQEGSHNKGSRHLLFSEIATSHGHYTKGSLIGLTNQKNNKLLSSTTGSIFESHKNISKLTPDTALGKVSEKISRLRHHPLQESNFYQLKSSTSAEFLKDLLSSQPEELQPRSDSQEDMFNISPQLVSNHLTLGESRPHQFSLHPVCPRPSAEDISTQAYSNGHLTKIMEELKRFVSHKDNRIGKLESQNSKLKAILATHGIPFEDDS